MNNDQIKMKQEQLKNELNRRLFSSERNVLGNYTANELYTRLKSHCPWVTDPKHSSLITGIPEVLKFLAQFPVADVRIMGPNLCELVFERPLTRLELKDLEMELNASFVPDKEIDHVVALFDPRDYDGK